MKAQAEPEVMPLSGNLTLDLDPDIIALGAYLCEKSGMTLSQFVEYLITKEAAKGK